MTSIDKGQLIYKARLAEQAGRDEDLLGLMKQVAQMDVELSADERNLLSLAFKNVSGSIRSSYRTIASIEKKLSAADATVDATKREAVQMYREKIQCEMEELCNDLLRLIDTIHLPKASDDVEGHVFYLKLKADYFRYLAEVLSNRDDSKDIACKCSEFYKQAHDLAISKLPSVSTLLLGVALNYSVFFYETANDSTSATQIAKTAFDLAMAELNDASDEVYRESVLIMQLIRDNLALWGNLGGGTTAEHSGGEEDVAMEDKPDVQPEPKEGIVSEEQAAAGATHGEELKPIAMDTEQPVETKATEEVEPIAMDIEQPAETKAMEEQKPVEQPAEKMGDEDPVKSVETSGSDPKGEKKVEGA